MIETDNEAIVSESRVATILFVDQVGSTRLLAELGDEAMVSIRGDLWSLFTSVVADHGGRVLSDEGDGGSATFEEPSDAALAGLAMLARTSERADLVLRAGCNTGPVLPTATGMVGLAIHLAARVCDAAPARHLAATDAAVAALRSASAPLRYTSLGRRNMKGLPEPVALSLVSAVEDPPPTLDSVDQPRSSSLLEEAVDAASFVGRSGEVVSLHRALFPPRTDRSNVVLLAGDPGSGKTALAYHVARELSSDGMLCLVGRSDEALDDPFFEIIEMLRHAVRSLSVEDLTEHVARHGTIATRLFPEIVDRLDLERTTSDVSQDRQQLFEAIGDLIATLAARQPVMLLLEDLHWASAQTLDLLRYLIRSELLFGVSVLVTLRPHDVAQSAAASDLLTWLTTERHPVRVDLRPLIHTEVVELCASLLDIASDDVLQQLAQHLSSQTGGNALFCTEMLRSLQSATGLLNSGTADIGALVVVPATIQDLALSRVRKLAPATAEVLADAAVLGESFDLVALQTMSSADAFDALDEAERAGIVRSDDAAGTQFTFGHALVQQALYHQQTTTTRLRRHRAAADAMSAERQGERGAWAFDRLHHLRNAGPLAAHREIAEAAGAAAVAAADKLALADTIQFRQLAVDQIELAGADAREQAVAIADLGRAQTANAMQIGKSTMVVAADRARAVGDWDLVADIAIAYGGELKENMAPSDVSEPVTLISQALQHHQERTARRARLLSALAVWQRQHRPYTERRAGVDEALSIARGLDDQHTLALILSERHRALHGPNAVAEAMNASTELEHLASDIGSNSLMFQALYLRVIGAMELGAWDLANEHSGRLIAVGSSLQNVEGRRVRAMWLNLAAQIKGDWVESRRLLDELVAIVSDYPRLELGRLLGASGFIGVWFEHGSTVMHQLVGEVGRASTRAWFAAEVGEEAEARRLIEAAPSIDDLVNSLDYMWWHDVVGLTRAAAALGDHDLAADLYHIILPYRDANAMMGFAAFMGAAEHHLGTLAATLGRTDAAREHYSRAAERHRLMGAVPFAELTAAELAALG